MISIGYYAAVIALALGGGDGGDGADGSTGQLVLLSALTLLSYLLLAVAYGYLSLTVPALATEGRRAPAWIGKPYRPTTVISAFERSIRLVGKRNILRVGLLYGGLLLIVGGLLLLVAAGMAAIIYLFATSLSADVTTLLSNGWTIFAIVTSSVLIAMSALLAYVAAVQTLLYLDLRMRREGLDLAMRFDCVPIPQPT